MARSKRPERCSLRLCGMVMRMPRRRRVVRSLRLLYPLSPTNRLGRRLGRPFPERLTAPWSNRSSATVASCCWPGVSTKVINRPWPSTRTCSLVLNPPWLRPKASVVGSLFLRPPHADEHVQWCHPQNALPSPVVRPGRPVPVRPPEYDPILQPASTGRSGWLRWTRVHSVPADHARALRCVSPTGCR